MKSIIITLIAAFLTFFAPAVAQAMACANGTEEIDGVCVVTCDQIVGVATEVEGVKTEVEGVKADVDRCHTRVDNARELVPAHEQRFHSLDEWQRLAEKVLDARSEAINADDSMAFAGACAQAEGLMPMPVRANYASLTGEAFSNFVTVCRQLGHVEEDSYGDLIFVIDATQDSILEVMADHEARLGDAEESITLQYKALSNLKEEVDGLHGLNLGVGGSYVGGAAKRVNIDLIVMFSVDQIGLNFMGSVGARPYFPEGERPWPNLELSVGFRRGSWDFGGGYQGLGLHQFQDNGTKLGWDDGAAFGRVGYWLELRDHPLFIYGQGEIAATHPGGGVGLGVRFFVR